MYLKIETMTSQNTVQHQSQEGRSGSNPQTLRATSETWDST